MHRGVLLYPGGPRRGFTLVELLVVMAILALLAVATLPALKGTLSSVNLKGAASTVNSEVDLARQTASTRNYQVDMRFYQDPNANNAYRIMALVITAASKGLDPTTNPDEFVGAPMALPGDTIFDPGTNFSSILNIAATGTYVPQAGPNAGEPTTAPLLVQQKKYVYISFLPNGTLNLDAPNSQNPNVTWCLSIRNQNTPTNGNTAPAADFVTLLFDPATSRARVYQP